MADETKKSVSSSAPTQKTDTHLEFGETSWEPPKPAIKEEPKRRAFEDLPPAAQRALKEAQERREKRDVIKESQKLPEEIGGRGGLDPTRYDDYEIDGRVIDF